MGFKDQDILVIGGASGIGKASAELFLAQGARVTIADHPDALSAVTAPLRTVALDVSALATLYETAATVGTFDALVITAGVTHFMPTEHEDPAAFMSVLQTNLAGRFFALRAFAGKVRDGGSIVVSGTVLANDYFFGAAALSSGFAATRLLAKTFAVELAPRHIRVNAVSVGPIDTPAWTKAGATDEDRAGVAKRTLLGRLGKAEEAAGAILYLCSDAASYVTATELVVDGGWRAA